jgi:transposase
MMYVGIDLHRKRSHITAMDEDGQVTLSRRVDNDPATIRQLLAEVGPEARIALEATYGWDWLAELVEDEGYDLRLAHPLGTRAIAAARVKTDAVDARTLAHLLRADLLPEAYLAPRELRDLRELLRLRIFLTRLRTGAKNRVHALLARHGLSCPRSDLFGKAGRAWLAEAPLRAEPRARVDALCRIVDDLEREIAELAAEIEERASADERVEALSAESAASAATRRC